MIFDSTAEKLRASMASQVFAAKLLTEKIAEEPGTLASMDSDVAVCSELVLKLQNVARYTSSVVGGTFAMFWASWKLSAAVWPLLVTGALHGARAGAKRAGKSAQQLAEAREDAMGFAEERLQHADLVRWFSRAEQEASVFRKKCDTLVLLAKKSARSRGIAHLVLDWASKGCLLGLASLGSRLVARGELTAGELTSFFFHASFLGLGLYGLVGLVPEVAVARSAASRLASVVGSASSSTEEPTPLAAEPSLAVSFKDVSFEYCKGSKEVLKSFSLEIAAGESCAIVGPSGCGKSTVLGLLLREFEAVQGTISIGGKDIAALSKPQLRSILAVAPQSPALLGSSVADAITFGAQHEASRPDIEAVSKAACAHNFVTAKPEGYDAPIGRGGELLSGGERQRVALARALIRRTPVLLLDEPTSGLDTSTAASFSQAVLARKQRPTMLVVTHSLELIRSCDSVAVISAEGILLQRGSFAELIADTSGQLAQFMRSGELEDDCHSVVS